MTTVSTLISAAFREGNIIPVGKSPTTAEAAEGLTLYNALLLSTIGFMAGNVLKDWQTPSSQRTGAITRDFPLAPGAVAQPAQDYEAYLPPNRRLVWDGSEQTVYLPEAPGDGALFGLARGSGASVGTTGTLTIDGNGRRIDGSDTATYATVGDITTSLLWLYRADLGNWLPVEAQASDDDCLFPQEFDDLWVCGVSSRLSPRYGKDVNAATLGRMMQIESRFKARYAQTAPAPAGGSELVPGLQSYGSGWMR